MKVVKLGILFINFIGLVFTIVTKNYQWGTYLVLFLLCFLFVFYKGNDYKRQDFFGKRAILASNIILLFFAVAVCRLINIQIFNQKLYARKIDIQSEALVISRGSRGEILDSTGKSLAYNVTNYTVAVDPSKIYEDNNGMKALNEILDLQVIKGDNKVKKDEFLKSLEESYNNKKKYKLLAKGISEEDKISMEKIIKRYKIGKNEIYFKGDFYRLYHKKDIYQSLVGFVGENDSSIEKKGLFGIERKYDSYLEGKALKKKIRVDRQRRKVIPTSTSEVQKRIDGQNVHLTIDNEINFVLNEEIRKKFVDTDAEGAFGIIMDPNNGRILGTASYYKDPNLSVRNGVFQDQVEPGSIFKPIIMASALNEKYFNKDTKFDIGNGTIKKYNHTVQEATKSLSGVIPASDIIRRSSNTGMVLVGDYFTNEMFENYLKNFGLYDITGVDFPNEKKPYTTPYKKWDKLKKSTMSFGQGIAITPIQMAVAFSAVINGGTLYRPYLVEKIESEDGVIIRRNLPHQVRRVITKETSDTMREILEASVADGTGTRAKVEGYRIGGKTGTGQVPGKRGAYLKNDYLASFIGFFPVEKPKYVVLIMVLKPNGKTINEKYGGSVAAPVFGEIVKRITKIKSIWVEEGNTDVTNISVSDILQNREGNGSKIELIGKMPDLTGLSSKEIIDNFHGTGLNPEIIGVGLVVDQEPKAGTSLENIKTVKVILGDGVKDNTTTTNNPSASATTNKPVTNTSAGSTSTSNSSRSESTNTNDRPIQNTTTTTNTNNTTKVSGSTTNTTNTNKPTTTTTSNKPATNTMTTTTTRPSTTDTTTTNSTTKPSTATTTTTTTKPSNTKSSSTQSKDGVNYGKKVGKYRELIINN